MKSNLYVDRSVSNEDFYRYERSIQVSLDGFSFSIVDVGGKNPRLVACGFEPIVATPVALLAVSLAHWLDTLPFKDCEFKRNVVVVDLDRSLIIPTAMFQENEMLSYCDLHFSEYNEEWDSCVWYQVSNSEIGVLFVIPISLLEVVKRYFCQFHLIHAFSLLLEEKQFKGTLGRPHVVASIRRRFMSVVLYDAKGQLRLCNRFELRGTIDIPYYLFSVTKQNNFNVSDTSVCLMGDVSVEWDEVALLQSEFNSVEFYNKVSYIDQDKEGLITPIYQYMPFLNVYRCEL
ncbi:DUF3822 family protein [Prolixibacteraceae bacterium]|nr:DUF3822 family protein [Prolixibacteraceae bacterium]